MKTPDRILKSKKVYLLKFCQKPFKMIKADRYTKSLFTNFNLTTQNYHKIKVYGTDIENFFISLQLDYNK